MKHVRGMNAAYQRLVPLTALLPAILLLIPFISNGGKTWFGWMFAAKVFASASVGIGFRLWAVLGLCVLPAALAVVGVWMLVRPGKGLAKAITWLLAGYTALAVLGLLIMKQNLDGTGLLAESMMIHDLSAGYWLMLVAGFGGMAVSMMSTKTNPGYILLVVLSVLWLFPIFFILLNALRMEGKFYIGYFFPKQLGLGNFIAVITSDTKFHYMRWFKNTLIVSVCSCLASSYIVLSTSYVLSRIRFRGRKSLMNLLLILGMFPSFMSMIAVYYILKGLGLAQSLAALVIVYSAGASLTYYVAKGFFDTIPRSLDEAAMLDGATKWQVFTKITMPLSKPIIIYTIMTSFMAPWADYIFASVILGDNTKSYTVAMGLFSMISRDNINEYFTQFAAGAVLVSIPIAVLFISLQKYYVEGLSGSVKG